MKNILLAGYYGFGNLGDEAILEMFLKYFRDSGNINKIVVLSGNPEETNKKYDVDSINRYNIISVISSLFKSDALVFGGGSLLQDVTSKRSIHYYLFLIRLAKIMGKKVVLLSQGIGPISHEYNLKCAGRALKKADIITVRDNMSMDILETMNIEKSKIKFSADPVIGLGFTREIKSSDRKTRVCFTLRNWKDVELTDEICRVVEKLYNDDIECVFICFYYNMDLFLIDELEKKLGNKAKFIKSRLSTQEAMEIIKSVDLLVGIRLHALILSASANVPFVALSYDPKIDQFLQCLDMKIFTDINNEESIDSEALYEEIIEKLSNVAQEKEKLEKSVNKLRETIQVNLDIIDNI